MSYPVNSLKPEIVWGYFDKIRQIPHGSENEKALAEAIMSWAKKAGCEAQKDKTGNVVVRVKATQGSEKAPTIVLQCHLDMVCEKNADKKFDFKKDAISLVRRDDWIFADGTTLGADNGIGLAVALSFMEQQVGAHGPLELLFTVEEETGLVGARGLEPGFVTGRMMFNLDSEEDGAFYLGCAGGRDSEIELPLKHVAAPKRKGCYAFNLKGLRGGHSGLDIIQNRGNAVRLLARALLDLFKEVDFSLSSIQGGDKHNAIPREATAVVFLASSQVEAAKALMQTQINSFRDEFASHEPDLSIEIEKVDSAATVLDERSMDKVLRLLTALPHGVSSMMRDIQQTVETSTNLARVRTENGNLAVLMSSRSSVASALDGIVTQISSVCRLAGAAIKVHEGYPGWKPNPNSKMLEKAKEVWLKIHGENAELKVIHAGLECGIIGERYHGMDMISLGPTIMNPHSPDEKVSIKSVERFFEFTKAFLAAMAK